MGVFPFQKTFFDLILEFVAKKRGKGVSPETMEKFKTGKEIPSITGSPEITNVFNASDLIKYIECLVGKGKVSKKFRLKFKLDLKLFKKKKR